ncbi:hypothetical protein AB1N83_012445 [Pleurotus pulmonarius]
MRTRRCSIAICDIWYEQCSRGAGDPRTSYSGHDHAILREDLLFKFLKFPRPQTLGLTWNTASGLCAVAAKPSPQYPHKRLWTAEVRCQKPGAVPLASSLPAGRPALLALP